MKHLNQKSVSVSVVPKTTKNQVTKMKRNAHYSRFIDLYIDTIPDKHLFMEISLGTIANYMSSPVFSSPFTSDM